METSKARNNMALVMAVVAVATIGGLLFGYDSGAINGTQAGLTKAFDLSEGGLGFTVGSLLIGCIFGAFFAGSLADKFGRRSVMRVAAVIFVAGAIVQGLAHSHLLFVIARICGGIAVGAASVLSPAYISEVAPAHIRGRMTTVQQIMIISGITAAFLVNYAFQQAAGNNSTAIVAFGLEAWRFMFLAQAIPAAVFLVALFFIPESPRYLVASGRHEEAGNVLTRLFGEVAAKAKVGEIRASFANDHRPRFRDLLTPAGGKGFLGIRSIVWVGIMLAVFQQLVGINVIFYYGSTLWQLAGFTEQDSLLINIVSGAVSIAACLVTIAVIDRIGRKPLLLIGSAGMAVTLFVMVYAFSQGGLDANGHLVLSRDMGTVAVVAANLYVVFFNVSWGPVMWVMLGEMFPNQIRGSALAVAGLFQWLANYLVAQTFPVMASGIGLTASYTFYAVSAVISFFLVLRFIKETKGKELEEMEG